MRRRDGLHAFERLDPALRLTCLGCLGAEALDEAVHVCDLALLLFVGRLLVGELFGAHPFERAVVPAVQRGAVLFDMQDLGADTVEKIAIVRDQQQGAAILLEPGFEPDHRVEIQVVGRFVQKQQVRAAHQCPCQVEAHAPAAGEIRERACLVLRAEAKTAHQAGGATVRLVAADVVELGVQVRNVLAVAILLGSGQFALQLPQAGVTVEHVLDCRLRGRRHLLRDVRDDPAGRSTDGSFVGGQAAEDQREQARLPGTVGTGQAGLLTGVYLKRGALEQQAWPAAQGDVVELQHDLDSVFGKRAIIAVRRACGAHFRSLISDPVGGNRWPRSGGRCRYLRWRRDPPPCVRPAGSGERRAPTVRACRSPGPGDRGPGRAGRSDV